MVKHQQQYDSLIVGQGLAGSLLAWELSQAGQKVFVVDNSLTAAASKVAAGIINPITGHRINMTYGFDQFISVAKQCYEQLSATFSTRLLEPVEQYRLIKNPGQLDYWQRRQQQVEYAQMLGQRHSQHPYFKPNDFGIAEIQQSYRLRVSALLDAIHNWLANHNAVRQQLFDYSKLEIRDSQVQVDDLIATRIIFCEGYQAIHNPWWQHLPFNLAKGEILTVKTELDAQATLLNWGNWLVSSTDGAFQLGSNYAWGTHDSSPTETVRQQLIDSARQYLSVGDLEITQHKAGIRPTTKLRQPFIGAHPDKQCIYCFNGFGSKGSLLIPYYAQMLTRHLTQNQPLPSDVTQCL